jgi:hypothetical protein
MEAPIFVVQFAIDSSSASAPFSRSSGVVNTIVVFLGVLLSHNHILLAMSRKSLGSCSTTYSPQLLKISFPRLTASKSSGGGFIISWAIVGFGMLLGRCGAILAILGDAMIAFLP